MPRPIPRSAFLRPPQVPRHHIPSLRHASTSSSGGPSLPRRLLSTTLFVGTGFALMAYYYDSRSILHEHVVMPLLRLTTDAEQGHKLAVRMLSQPKWARPRDRGEDGPELQAELFGMKLVNPVGMAAGFDKDAECIDGLFDLGFGYVEVGSVTPEPQPGNPKPRFFRLAEDSAAINRYGFNSFGHGHALQQLRTRLVHFSRHNPSLFPSPLPLNPLPPLGLPRSLRPGHILAVNLGKNKTSPADSNEDYIRGVRTLGPYADVVVINVSSPNTPGLRALQGKETLERLLKDVVEERDRIQVQGLPKVAVKVACDLSEDELADVASAVRSSGVEGVIVSNTTVRRDLGLVSSYQGETGGLSGAPLFPLALHAVRTIRPLLPPQIPVIGCGGITSSTDALLMARAGASIVQLYTSFGYRGVGTPRLLKDAISADLTAPSTGLGSTWKAQVGKDWEGQGGWDEKRVREEGERVRREVERLGEMMRELEAREGLSQLVLEVEQALGQAAGVAEIDGAARDNALGATGEEGASAAPDIKGMLEDVVDGGSAAPLRGLIEAATATAPVPDEEPVVIVVVAEEPEQHTVRGVDLRPAFVPDEPVGRERAGGALDTEDDPWVREARSGSRRLV